MISLCLFFRSTVNGSRSTFFHVSPLSRMTYYLDFLIKNNIASYEEIQGYLKKEGRNDPESLIKYIVQQTKISEEEILKLCASELGYPFLQYIPDDSIQPDLVDFIPIHFFKKNALLPFIDTNGQLKVATSDPFQIDSLDQLLHLLSRDSFDIVLSPGSEIISAINRTFDQVKDKEENIIQDISNGDEGAAFVSDFAEGVSDDLLDETSDAPIIKLVNYILSQAIKYQASDIHIEPYQHLIKIRYRMDGVLYDIHTLPKKIHASVVSRVKVLSQLNIAEKRIPQDGRIQVRIGNRSIDLRVSTLPTAFGERIVLRLLEKDQKVLNLIELGLNEHNLYDLQNIIHISHGIILVTGPTGSGKTTTLYAALNEINTPDKNILTIEDPIEYQLDGIGQMQVNSKIGLTFAGGLRSMVRQDPDVILVGEIRDLETAEIAIQASLTGHLVFSTLHTNDAAGAITRLIDMGIEPFLVSSSVRAIIAQRLVRTLCPYCRETFEPDPEQYKELGIEHARGSIHRANGCESCMNTGYKGRTGIFEFLNVSEDLQSLILRTSESNKIRQAAVEAGMKTLRQVGMEKVLHGRTSLDEVIRVTQA